MSRKTFWESVESKIRNEKPNSLSGKQLAESISEKWEGKKEKLINACDALKEMTSIYESDAHAKKFIDTLDEATSKIYEVMSDDSFDPKKGLITIIASSEKKEGDVVDEKEEKEEKKDDEKDEVEVELKEEKEEEKKDDEEKEDVKETMETGDSDYLSRLGEIAKKRKSLEEKKDEKEEVEEKPEEKEEKEEIDEETPLERFWKSRGQQAKPMEEKKDEEKEDVEEKPEEKEDVDEANTVNIGGMKISQKALNQKIVDSLSKEQFSKLVEKIKKECHGRDYNFEVKYIMEYKPRNKILNFILDNTPKNQNTLILVSRIEAHLKVLEQYLKKQYPDKKLEIIYGATDALEREKIRSLLERETGIILLASYKTVSTGMNVKNLHQIVFFSSYKSKITVLQSIGRGLRTNKNKDKLVLFDIVDDLSYETRIKTIHRNYIYKHFIQRLKYYKQQGFNFVNKIIKV